MSERCGDCGQEAQRVRGDWNFDESGLDGVVLKNIEIIRCGACGDAPVFPRMSRILDALAPAVSKKSHPLMPKEIRFLRSHAGMGVAELARWLHVDPAQIERWETAEERPGAQMDRLIRAVALSSLDQRWRGRV